MATYSRLYPNIPWVSPGRETLVGQVALVPTTTLVPTATLVPAGG